MGAIIVKEITPQLDIDGITVSQTFSGGGVQNFNLDGVFVKDGIASFDGTSHIIEFAQASDETGRTYTITGTDSRGVVITESVAGSVGTASSTKYFKTITSITIDANSAGAIEVGTSGLACSDWVLFNREKEINIGLGVQISAGGALTYSVQYTFENVQRNEDFDIVTFPHDAFDAKTTNESGNFGFSSGAYRLATTAYTSGSVKMISSQAY
jgi:hypothetical protein